MLYATPAELSISFNLIRSVKIIYVLFIRFSTKLSLNFTTFLQFFYKQPLREVLLCKNVIKKTR